MRKITVQIPASTSNLGPGYDCLGVALRLYNRITIIRDDKGRSPLIVSETARLFFRKSRVRSFPYSCEIQVDVPASRGLGGSATVRLGILHGLNRLAGTRLDRTSIFRLAAQLEGHPDNAAPASFGGFTVVQSGASVSLASGTRDARPTFQRFEVDPRLYFVLLIPDFEIETAKARKVLPSKIERAGAIESCANACAITAAFASRDYEKLRGTFADHLHQPFRQKLIPFLPRVIAAAEKAGALGAFLSGSGSTIAAVTLQSPKKVASAMLRATKSSGARTVITTADNHGVSLNSQRSTLNRSDVSLD